MLWLRPNESPPSNTFAVTPPISNIRMNTAHGILNCPKATTDRMSTSSADTHAEQRRPHAEREHR